MIVALIDNGSLEAAAHLYLRAVAAAVSARAGAPVVAVSWKHSDRVPPVELDHMPAPTLAPWVRAQVARGERDFVFIPFFISAQGAIGSALRNDLERLQREVGAFTFTFTRGLASPGRVGDVVAIVSQRVRAVLAKRGLWAPAVIVVDHGGPSAASAALRDEIAAGVRAALGNEASQVAAASMEGANHAHNRPLLADELRAPGFDRGDVVIAPLFLSPGRHAGPEGDLAQIAAAAGANPISEVRLASVELRCHFTGLVGTHPLVADALAAALRDTLSQLHAETLV